VVAGPGSGKTFCLIERIRFLIGKGTAPDRICAFTFTNKAAEEVATRLEQLGPRAAAVKRTTIHKFCVEVLREFGTRVGVPAGFGIADDDYAYSIMWRIEANPKKHSRLLQYFTLHRLKGDDLLDANKRKLEKYLAILKDNNLLDFDGLLVKAAELLTHVPDVADTVRERFDAILVDEFQDLNRVQYAIVKSLAQDHKNVFAVGDYDQSIYGWAVRLHRLRQRLQPGAHHARREPPQLAPGLRARQALRQREHTTLRRPSRVQCRPGFAIPGGGVVLRRP
jgi:DNA helicase-2/ATP-dependent DNA helicase PcrA